MLKKTITYVDYDGNERTEDFYFNLNKAELVELNLSEPGGLPALIQKIVSEKDSKQIIETFKKIILKSYGEKSLDGKRFIKSEELSTAFTQTEAYVNLYMELAFNDASATEFINGVVPDNFSEIVNNATKDIKNI